MTLELEKATTFAFIGKFPYEVSYREYQLIRDYIRICYEKGYDTILTGTRLCFERIVLEQCEQLILSDQCPNLRVVLVNTSPDPCEGEVYMEWAMKKEIDIQRLGDLVPVAKDQTLKTTLMQYTSGIVTCQTVEYEDDFKQTITDLFNNRHYDTVFIDNPESKEQAYERIRKKLEKTRW